MPRYLITFDDGSSVEKEAANPDQAKQAAKAGARQQSGATTRTDPRVKVRSVVDLDAGRGPTDPRNQPAPVTDRARDDRGRDDRDRSRNDVDRDRDRSRNDVDRDRQDRERRERDERDERERRDREDRDRQDREDRERREREGRT